MASRGGRPSKLTPETQAQICKLLAGGNTREDAARGAGVSLSILNKWMAAGRRGERRFEPLLHAVKEAEAKAIRVAVRQIRLAGKRQWQALAWWLERRYPEVWGSNSREINELRKRLDAVEGKGA